jgi:hypothetical protein
MREEHVVQFVCFETPLDTEDFVQKWEQFTRSVNSDVDVTVQQTKKNEVFRYIVQHRCSAGQFQFVFEKGRRSSKIKEVSVKTEQAGGYSALQLDRKEELRKDESKLFVFFTEPVADLDIYRQLTTPHKLNIYEPYYENCRYAYILEYFTKTKWAESLLDELKKLESPEPAIYKECVMELS